MDEQHAQAMLNMAYRERNALVAFLVKEWGGFFCEGSPDEPGWGIAWAYPDNRQMSWHIPERDFDLFAGVATGTVKYDGHTTEEKYDRLRRLGDEIMHSDEDLVW